MAPTKVDQGTVIILDVGKNVSQEEKNGTSFFKTARECAARIIERKILSQANNLVGIILLGSKKTNNNLADQCPGSFKHIELLADLQAPTWDMIRNIPELPSKGSRGDWFDALIVAADHLKNGVSGVKMSNKKIILMTNFEAPANAEDSDIERAINGLKEECFEVDIIGIDIYDEKHNKNEDVGLAQSFVSATNGASATFDYTMSYLLFHKKKATNALPWNVDLNIGNIKIPVSSYIRLKDEPIVKKWLKAIKDPCTNSASTVESIVRNKEYINTEIEKIVIPTSIIKGLHYGQEIIPFTQCDKDLLYNSGEKSLSVYGFTKASNLTWQAFNGDGLSYIFGRKGDKNAQHAVRCLVECLHELDLVGLVRKVHNKGNAPKMFALMPVIDSNDFICLSMASVVYKEEIKIMAFPATNHKKYNCSDEQISAFEDLIKAMDLTKAYDDTFEDTEAFPIAETVSPSAQYVLDCIAFRAMNPGKPLPQPRDDIMMLFKQPALIEKRSRDCLERVKKLFDLVKVEEKINSRRKSPQMPIDNAVPTPDIQKTDSDLPKVQLPVITKDVNVIGTGDPIKDFKTLYNKGKSLADLCPQLTEAIESLFMFNLDGAYTKPIEVMSFFRKECVDNDPLHYNTWLQKFRSTLNAQNKTDIINAITENKLGFIVKEENDSSTYITEDSHDESQLYENDTIPNSAELTIDTAVNDMFDEM